MSESGSQRVNDKIPGCPPGIFFPVAGQRHETFMSRRMLTVFLLLCILLVGGLVACTEIGYYSQAIKGHTQILIKRRPIAELIADPTLDPQRKERLALVLRVREFASKDLLLPDNGSYRCFVDLGRAEVVWNVVAAPEFSLGPLTWCFPIAGCVSYRGYYDRSAAEAFADQLRQKGNDVDLYGVTAYSTLGWFDDPVLNTFIDRPEPALAGMIFHELAHQKLYVKDDSSFSEAFAEVVEREGVARWLKGRDIPSQQASNDVLQKDQERFVTLLMTTRKGLEALYASDLPPEAMRVEKTRIIAALHERFRQLRQEEWKDNPRFDRWFDRPVNNARLAAVATYHDLKPALEAVLRECNDDLECFYQETAKLAGLPYDQRRARLATLDEQPGKD